MNTVFARITLTCALSLAAAFCAKAADDNTPPKPVEPVKPDNTKINERDRPADRLTADQQSQSKGDVEATAKIRQLVVKDDTLSTKAHNVKIITINGKVTLRGPVKSDGEKMSIDKKAREVVGDTNVTNELEIAP
jgi:hyperosmotically inducible periplasmic protein